MATLTIAERNKLCFVDELNSHSLNHCHDVFNAPHDHYGTGVGNGELVTMGRERSSLDPPPGHMGMSLSPLSGRLGDCGVLSCDPGHEG